MTETKIILTTIEDVKEFVGYALSLEYAIDLISGKYVVDGKSIMGIFSLDLSKPLVLKAHTDDCRDFLDNIKKYIV